jgi:SAM-dependent methyltransferase
MARLILRPGVTEEVLTVKAIWQDLECSSYSADLGIWEDLAKGAEGPILELGCGTGRVALHLARRGHEVIGIDSDEELVLALADRAGALPLQARLADLRDFELDTDIALALGPMQVLQLLPTPRDRRECLLTTCAHLLPGGRIALAIVERPSPIPPAPALPDVREVDGWLYCSEPLSITEENGEIAIRRRREAVSPSGQTISEESEVRIQALSAEQLEAEGVALGLRPIARLTVPSPDLHVASTIVVLERPG